MTNLTEDWKKGKLIEGKKYYCVSKNIAYMLEAECHDKGQDDEWWVLKNEKYRFNNVHMKNDIEVLEQVPSCKEYIKLKADCKALAQKLLQVNPELKEWLEVNYKEYL